VLRLVREHYALLPWFLPLKREKTEERCTRKIFHSFCACYLTRDEYQLVSRETSRDGELSFANRTSPPREESYHLSTSYSNILKKLPCCPEPRLRTNHRSVFRSSAAACAQSRSRFGVGHIRASIGGRWCARDSYQALLIRRIPGVASGSSDAVRACQARRRVPDRESLREPARECRLG